MEAVYFWFSLLFLFGRMLMVSLFAAEINSESKKPADVLRAIPEISYSKEVCFACLIPCFSL